MFRITLLCLLCFPLWAKVPADAPPLPGPGAGLTVVNVATAQELADACWNLQSDTAIVIAAGTYNLASVSFPNGVDGRLTVGRFGATPISNIQIRGATGNPQDVVLLGAGMLDTTVPFGFQVFTATDVTIADLSIGNVYYHSVAIQGDQGAQRVRLYNGRFFDAGQQIIKASGGGSDDVVIEYSEVFYSVGAIVHPEGSPPNSCYTNGIDAIGSDGWIIRDNLIRDIKCQNGALAGPSILMWQGSSNTLVERNTILDSSRGISLGLVSGPDHTGGIARNNFIRWEPSAGYAVDVPIYTTSANAKILHNSILTNGEYPNAVEVRYSGAVNVEVKGNLMDGVVMPRNGAAPDVSDNDTQAQPAWFVDEAAGDLHLSTAGRQMVMPVERMADALEDFDGTARPGIGTVGADEPITVLFADSFERPGG